MTTLEELERLCDTGKWKKVIKKADEILDKTPFEGDTGDTRRFSFMTREAYYLYMERNPDRQTVWIKNRAAVAYCKAYALTESGRYEEAEKTLLLCRKLDPVSVKILSELFSVYIRLGRNDRAAACIQQAEGNILSAGQAALVYAKKAYLASVEQDLDTARRLCHYSLLFEENNAARRELVYIAQQSGEDEACLTDESRQKQAAESLFREHIVQPLPQENMLVLKKLRALYTAGNEPQQAAHFDCLIKQLEAVTEVIQCSD